MRSEFRKKRFGEAENAELLLRQADEYTALLEAVHAHKDLLISHNISTGAASARETPNVIPNAKHII